MLRPFLVYLPSPQGIIIQRKCSCSNIQVYLYEDVFQTERAFHLDRSQWLSSINFAHLHWYLQKSINTILILLLRLRVGNKNVKKKVNSCSFNVIAVFLQLFQFVKCRRTSLVELSKEIQKLVVVTFSLLLSL